ncbi:hypothetical protein EBB06_03325 [Crenobacter cavernae]|uniref:Uncharacterized protein n=2 Tax=Crenobacter cavernae TaxID=2290923 RepID=A0ABY0FF56_9NEIS|nr:hypothetical protein EBB06_03325 [Crenobacter cavernae]
MMLWLLCASALAQAAVNMEFKFTPFAGAEDEADKVEVVPGTARVYVNDALHSEQKLARKSVPVLSGARDVAPAVRLPVSSLGDRLKNGQNTLRIEFAPDNVKKPYRVQFGWAAASDSMTATDDSSRQRRGSHTSSTGRQTRDAVGPATFESRFSAISAVGLDELDAAKVVDRDEADGASRVAGEAMRRQDLTGARPREVPADAGATQLPNLPNTPPPSAAASAPPPSSSSSSPSSPWGNFPFSR